jgi:hypothetical protein
MDLSIRETLYMAQAACIVLAALSLSTMLIGIGSYRALRIKEAHKDRALLCLLIAFGAFLLAFALCTVPKWMAGWSAPSIGKTLALLGAVCAGGLCVLMGNMLLSAKRERRAL